MDDSTTNQSSAQSMMPPVAPMPDPMAQAAPVVPTPVVKPEPVPAAPAAPSADDLQKITQDLQNLAQEVAQTTPPTSPSTDVGVSLGVNVPPIAAAAVAPVVTPQPANPQNSLIGKQSITIYTITDCQYCKAEKEFLKSKGLEFTEKNVETDEESLKEMLSAGENFAGVPVTMLEGPTGQKVVVKGFTQTDFEEEMKKVGFPTSSTTNDGTTLGVNPTSPAVSPVADVPVPPAAPAPIATAPLPQIPNIN